MRVDLADANVDRRVRGGQRLVTRIDRPVVDDEVGTGLAEQLDEPRRSRVACRRDRRRARTAPTPRSAGRAGSSLCGDARSARTRRSRARPSWSASVISLSRPPMTPPTPIGASLASQINRSSVVSVRSTPSSVDDRLALGRAARMRKPAAAQRDRGRRRGSAG